MDEDEASRMSTQILDQIAYSNYYQNEIADIALMLDERTVGWIKNLHKYILEIEEDEG